MCTKDAKYAQLRKAIAAHGGKGTVLVVGVIAAALAAVLGIAAGVLTPFISLLLLIVGNLGLNVACARFAPPKP